jgi:PAS domain S-box-containing protein
VTPPRTRGGKRALELKHPAEVLNATVVELALDCIVSIDHEGRVIEFNPAAERTFGYKRADVLGKLMAELIIPPHLRQQHFAGIRRYLETGEARVLGKRLTLEAMRSDGTTFPVELAIVRVPLPGNAVFISYVRDLSWQQRGESRQKLLLEASAVLSSSLDHEETLRNISKVVVPRFADWYSVEILDKATGEPRRLHVDHRDPDKVSLAAALAERYPDRREDRGVRKVLRTGVTEWMHEIPKELLREAAQDDEHREILLRLGLRSYIIAPLKSHGVTLGAIAFITAESGRLYDADDVAVAEDLAQRAGQAMENARLFREVDEQRALLVEQQTELEAQAAELEETALALETSNQALREKTDDALRARDEAFHANKAKSAFLAAMSHELRTPLNAIMGYVDLMTLEVHGPITPDQRERLERVKRSANHLLGLINDVLSFARLEAGRITYEIGPVAVAEVLQSTEEILAPQIETRRVRYTTRNDCSDTRALADREKLLQILINLLSNAVKHTPENGQILLACARSGDTVTFTVTDTGPGIPAEQLEEIFKPFTQVEDPYVGEREGAGLGLAISRDLARAMQGEVTVESKVGKGSTFTLAMPVAKT